MKLIGTLIFIGAAWARVEMGLSSINERLEKIESTQTNFLRSDLAEARQQTIESKLDALRSQIERIQLRLENGKVGVQ